jgi:Ca-activated chloride channel family protein
MVNRYPGSRRWPLVAAVVVGLLAIVATYLVLRPGPAAPAGTAGRPECIRLEVSSSTEKGDLLAELAKGYNLAGRGFGGRCAAVSVHKKTSGAAMDALAAGWDAARDGSPAPQVWTPTASLWLGLLRAKAAAADRAVLPDGEFPSIAKSPLAIAMLKPMADELHRSGHPIGWADVLALSADPRGWASRGHPEWGRFTFGKDNPHLSTSGLAATIAAYYAATGRSSDLTEADLTDPKVTRFVSGVESGVVHYSDDAVKFLSNLTEADAQGKALSYVHAIAMQEELVYLYNQGAPTGDPAQLGKGRKPSVPLVAIHPADGTLMLDHPYVVLPSASADQRAAAADFLSYLREPAQQRRLTDLGFRDANGVADSRLTQAIGADAGEKLSLINPPAPNVLTKILSGWDDLRKKARVLLVMDVSGSMNNPAGSGRSRLEAAKQAAVQGLGLLHPDDEVGLWSFSTEQPGAAEPYQEVAPLVPLKTGRAQLTAAINGLHAEGGTALYHTVRGAQRYMVEQLRPDRINAIVLLTDGKNEYPKDNDVGALLRDIDATNLELSVRVFAIAFGDQSDLDVLAQIGKASRAAAYDARDPATIDRVFISVLSNF